MPELPVMASDDLHPFTLLFVQVSNKRPKQLSALQTPSLAQLRVAWGPRSTTSSTNRTPLKLLLLGA